MHGRMENVRAFLSGTTSWDLTEPGGGKYAAAIILPEQFYQGAPNLSQGRPEADLMRAVLEDAVQCIRVGLSTTSRRHQRLAREAEQWFESQEMAWPFSFLNICTVLGLDPHYIRGGLRCWQHQRPLWTAKNKRRVVRPHASIRFAA
jgi:hypothetical protein